MQTITDEQAIRNNRYSFLTRPPPQKREPTWAIPSPPVPVISPSTTNPPTRRRASTIAAWAALVQPGTPAPISPHRRLSIPSVSRIGRRTSISHSQTPSALSGLVQPASAAQDIAVDLSAFGYTSPFAPRIPPTPSPLVHNGSMKKSAAPLRKTSRTIKRIRSLNFLNRNKPKPSTIPTSPVTEVQSRAETIAKHKKAKYNHVRPPPPLANDVALMQFIDGGSSESNAKRLMEHRARATGTTSGVDAVYRDGNGGFWLDQDEEMEYAHLLDGDSSGEDSAEMQWVKFGSEDGTSPLKTGIIDLAESRRESVSTHHSDLDPAYIVLPIEDSQCGPEDIVLSYNEPQGSPFKGDSPIVPGLSVLSLPSRPNRAAKHLRKTEFLVDVAAFGPRSPVARHPPRSSEFPLTSNVARPTRSPKSARFSSMFILPTDSGKGKKVKRRPAPLDLAPVNVGWQRVGASEDALARSTSVEASTAPVNEVMPQKRGKVIIASLVPRDDLARCRELADKMLINRKIDNNGIVRMDAVVVNSSSQTSRDVGKRMKLGLGGLFGRK